MATRPFTVIVSSCDPFSDTWEPFFTLYKANVAALESSVTLITERREFTFPGLDLHCTRANQNFERRLTWSECVIDALSKVENEIVLYLQDDYFVEEPVDVERLCGLAEKMIADPEIGCIALTSFSTPGPFAPTNDPDLLAVSPHARYRINLQAAFWRKSTMLSYLRPDENAWMFELFGTSRSKRRQETFLAVRQDKVPPIVYQHTGIIKGKWHRGMPALFERYGLTVDFTKRGFYDAPPLFVRKWQTFRTLLASPSRLWRGLRGV